MHISQLNGLLQLCWFLPLLFQYRQVVQCQLVGGIQLQCPSVVLDCFCFLGTLKVKGGKLGNEEEGQG